MGIYGVWAETTEQVRHESEKNEEIQRLKQLFHRAPGLLAVVRGPEHVFEVANSAYMELIGQKNIIGKRVRDVLPELEAQGIINLLNQVYQTGEPFIGRAVPMKIKNHLDHQLEEYYFDFIYQPVTDDQGKVTGIFAEGIDVTSTVKATKALRESEKRFRTLTEVSPQIVWTARANGAMACCNQHWYSYTGLTPEQTWNDGWKQVLPPDYHQQLQSKWSQAMANGTSWQIEVPLRQARDGAYRWHLMKGKPIRDDEGNVTQWMGIAIDIDQQKKTEAKLRDYEKQLAQLSAS